MRRYDLLNSTAALLLFVVCAGESSAQYADSLRHDLALFDSEVRSHILSGARGRVRARLNAACTTTAFDDVDGFVRFLSSLASYQRSTTGLSGSIQGGLNVDEATDVGAGGPRRKVKLNTKVDLERGSYAHEIELRAIISLDLESNPIDGKQGAFRENLSTLHLSYDRYWKPWLESFVFIERHNDDFLAIDQRYEVGGGWNIVIFKGLGITTSAGRSLANLTFRSTPADVSTAERGRTSWFRDVALDPAAQLTSPNADISNNAWLNCYQTLLRTVGRDQTTAERRARAIAGRFRNLRLSRAEAVEGIRKESSRLQLSVLSGVFVDIDKRSPKFSNALVVAGLDSVSVKALRDSAKADPDSTKLPSVLADTTDATIFPLLSTRRYWFEVRPTVKIRLTDPLQLRGDWYFKFPISPHRSRADERRTHLIAALDWSLAGFTVSASYNKWFERTPPIVDQEVARKVLSDQLDDAVPVDFALAGHNVHHLFVLTFGARF